VSTGWAVSLIVLWAIVLILSGVLLWHLGDGIELRQPAAIAQSDAPHIPPSVEQDGPSIGTQLPDFRDKLDVREVQRIPTSTDGSHDTLIVFLAPLCTTCHRVSSFLNALSQERSGLTIVAVVVGVPDAVDAYLKLFPLAVPVVRDPEQQVMRGVFNVRTTPFALFYDRSGQLVRKAVPHDPATMLPAMLDGIDASTASDIYPMKGSGGAQYQQVVSQR
jgi:thiol-disulfide isomerase/thioredoxin